MKKVQILKTLLLSALSVCTLWCSSAMALPYPPPPPGYCPEQSELPPPPGYPGDRDCDPQVPQTLTSVEARNTEGALIEIGDDNDDQEEQGCQKWHSYTTAAGHTYTYCIKDITIRPAN